MAKTPIKKATFKSIMTDIRARRFAPVYILYGAEPYYLDEITKALENYVVDKADRDFNHIIAYGNDTDIDTVVGCCKQYPVMAERQLVILKEAQSMYQAKSAIERLAPYIEHPNSTTVFALVYKGDSLTEKSALLKAAAKSDAVIYESVLVKDYHLPGSVKDYCTSHKIGIEDKAVMMLCEYVGNPLNKLYSEIDKLCMACGDRCRITADDIETYIGISKDYNSFELKTALASRNYAKAVSIVKYFKSNPRQNPVPLVVGTISSFFISLTIAAFMQDKSESALLETLNMSRYSLNDIQTGLRNYNATQCVRTIRFIRDFDCKSKGIGSSSNEFDLMFDLIFNIITC